MSRYPVSIFLLSFATIGFAQSDTEVQKKENVISAAKLGSTRNVHKYGNLFLAGQFNKEDIEVLKNEKITRVITLRTDQEIDWDEKAAIEAAGMEFFKFPFRSPEALTDEVFDGVRKLLKDKKKTTLFHCGSANRVGGVWLPFRVLDEGVELKTALKEAKEIGLHTAFIEDKAVDYIERMKKAGSDGSSSSTGTSTKGSTLGNETPTYGQANWPSFRGNGNSITELANLPLEWNDDKNIQWKADLPGYGQSSPVIWGDRVFVTTMQGKMKEVPTILCFTLADGKQHWEKEFKSSQEVKASNYVTRSAPTPAVDPDRCYSFFESGELIATTHDGSVTWQRSLVNEYGEFKGNHGIGSSIVIDDQSVYVLVAHDGPSYLLAVDKSTGQNRWKTDLAEKVSWSSPTLADGQIILSVSGTVQGFDVESGEQLWSVDDVKGNTVSSVTVHEDVVFVGSSEREQNFAVRFDATGKSDKTEIVWRNDDVKCSFSSPLYHSGHVYYVNKQGAGFAVDAKTGEQTWKTRLSGSCWASPIGAGDNIFFFTKEGATDVYTAGAEPEFIKTNKLTVKDRVYGVAVADSRFIVRTGTRLICVSNQEEKEPVQQLTIPEMPVAVTSFGAAVCDGYLYYYGGNKGAAHSYSAEVQNEVFRRIKLNNGAEWESLGEVPRRQGNALVAYKGKVYRIGGFEARNKNTKEDEDIVSTKDFAVYDPSTSKWTDLIPLPEPRSSFDAVVAGDSLYVVGGWALQGNRDDSEWHGTAWRMDLSQEKLEWKSIAAPPERRANSLAQLDGKIYLIGGMDDDGLPTQSVMVFDPEANKWTDGPKLPGIAMDGFGSSSFNVGDRIIVSTFGGQVIRLSEDGKNWEEIDKLTTGRFFHRLLALSDNRVAILGGTGARSGKQNGVLVLDVPKKTDMK